MPVPRPLAARLLLVAFVALAASPGRAAPAAPDGEAAAAVTSERATDGEAALVTWQELRARPSLHLGRRVRLEVQFQGRLESWNPYQTRFGARDFRAVRAWSDEQFPWRLADYEAPAVRLFFRRAGACDRLFEHARPFVRFAATGVVREVFRGEPWIEIEAAHALAEQITEGGVIHAGRAGELFAARQWELGDAELARALDCPLPPKARAELERVRAAARESAEADKGIDVQRKPR